MSYRIDVTYSPKSFKEMDEIDAELIALSRDSCTGSGFGGSRDISFQAENKQTAEKLAVRLAGVLENRGKEYTIDVDKCE